MNTKARYPSGRFASSSEFRRWLNAQYPGGASQDEQTAALYGWQAGRKEAEARVKKLEEALRRMTPLALLDDRQRIAEIALGIPYYRKRGEEGK